MIHILSHPILFSPLHLVTFHIALLPCPFYRLDLLFFPFPFFSLPFVRLCLLWSLTHYTSLLLAETSFISTCRCWWNSSLIFDKFLLIKDLQYWGFVSIFWGFGLSYYGDFSTFVFFAANNHHGFHSPSPELASRVSALSCIDRMIDCQSSLPRSRRELLWVIAFVSIAGMLTIYTSSSPSCIIAVPILTWHGLQCPKHLFRLSSCSVLYVLVLASLRTFSNYPFPQLLPPSLRAACSPSQKC